MGCFIGCFRGRDDQRRQSQKHLLPDSSVSKSMVNYDPEAAISRNRLSSLFLVDENEDIPSKDVEAMASDSPRYMNDLKKEAKFLKACGTLMETPIEIKKASHKLQEFPPRNRDYNTIQNDPCLRDTLIKNQLLGNQLVQPCTPIEIGQESDKGSASSENSPSSCVTSEQNTRRIFLSSSEVTKCDNTKFKSLDLQPDNMTSSNGRSKSVRFECQMNARFSETPLKLSDEMQTPGTVFPTNLDNLQNGRTRNQTQYINSALDPVEDLNISTPISAMGEKESLKGSNMNIEASLSAWLKPVNQNCGALSRKTQNFGTIPGEERPILGMVAAHWYEDQPPQISSKWWDGNGIPNSTNKYKEDQKVSWHATPFEERLEKALSEESSISQRKQFEKERIGFEEEEESDTAVSQFQSASAHPKSVVSF